MGKKHIRFSRFSKRRTALMNLEDFKKLLSENISDAIKNEQEIYIFESIDKKKVAFLVDDLNKFNVIPSNLKKIQTRRKGVNVTFVKKTKERGGVWPPFIKMNKIEINKKNINEKYLNDD